MKLILILILILSSQAFGEPKTEFDKKLEQMLLTTGVSEFRDDIIKIKKHESVDKITELEYNLKPYFEHILFWYYFDAENYYSELRYKIKMSMTLAEINEVNQVFQKPFLKKVLKAATSKRELFTLYNRTLDSSYEYPKLVASRVALIKNVLIMYGANLQIEHVKKRLEEVVSSGKTLLTILSTGKKDKLFIDPSDLKLRLANVELFFIQSFANDMKEFRHYELREFLRLMKKSKAAQKYIQIYMNYHYFYIAKYIEKVEQDKSLELKALAVE